MTDRPILFSGPMVRALLEGRKTQTRRVLKPQPPAGSDLVGIYAPGLTAVFEVLTQRGPDYTARLPYMPGDRLWVREAWHAARSLDITPPRDIPRDADIEHAATARSYAEIGLKGKLRPGMFMPRWASRLTLLVTDVRVQRLQEITAGDLSAEGMFASDFLTTKGDWLDRGFASIEQCCFHDLWDGLNAARGFGWAANPWVVAVTFEVERRNIDHG